MPPPTKADVSQASLIGRQQELARLWRYVHVEWAPLTTVLGAPGIGKSALVSHFIHASLQAALPSPTRIVSCDLCDASAPDVLACRLAERLALGGVEDAKGLERALPDAGRAVIVLENFERLAEAAAVPLDRWSAAAPEVSWLVASRVRVRLGRERLVELGPLGLPSGASDVEESEAGRLWARCVRARDGGYELAGDETARVARLLHQLDGIPLAIELAAGRRSVLGVEEILARLERRFELLQATSSGLGESDRTLRGALEGSWEILASDEQRLLAHCAVFHGGFTVEAVEAVAPPPKSARPTLDVLQELRDKSLVRFEGERLSLFLAVRDFAAEKLAASGEQDACRMRYVQHHARLADRTAEAGAGEITAERENVSAAIDHALERGDPDALGCALRMLCSLYRAGAIAGRLNGWIDRVDRALKSDLAEAPLRARGLWTRGHLLRRTGRSQHAHRDFVASAALAAGCRDSTAEASALASAAQEAARAGESLSRASALASRALEAAAASGDRAALGSAHLAAAWVANRAGRYGEDVMHLERCAALHAEAGEVRSELAALNATIIVLANLGDVQAARAHLRRLGELRAVAAMEADSLFALGILEHASGRHAIARDLYARGAELAGQSGEAFMLAACNAYALLSLLEEGELEVVRNQLPEVVEQLKEHGEPEHAAVFRAIGGAVEAWCGSNERAARAVAEAREILERAESPLVAVAEIAACAVSPARELPAAVGLEARALRRLVEQKKGALPDRRAEAVSRRPTLQLAARMDWFELDGMLRRAIATRPTLGRVLAALARARSTTPGAPVPAGALADSGWPGERMVVHAARARVKMSISRLRQLGLREVLLSDRRGYWLSPDVDVVVVSDGARP